MQSKLSAIPGVHVTAAVGRTSSFEVTAGDTVLHSKLKGGGKVESKAEYDALVAKLKPLIGA